MEVTTLWQSATGTSHPSLPADGRFIIPLLTPSQDDVPIAVALEMHTSESLARIPAGAAHQDRRAAASPAQHASVGETNGSSSNSSANSFDVHSEDVPSQLYLARFVLDGEVPLWPGTSHAVRQGDTLVQLVQLVEDAHLAHSLKEAPQQYQVAQGELQALLEGREIGVEQASELNHSNNGSGVHIQRAQHANKNGVAFASVLGNGDSSQQYHMPTWVRQVTSTVEGLPDVAMTSLLLVMPPDAAPFFDGDWRGAQHGIHMWCQRHWVGHVAATVEPRDVEVLMMPALRFAQLQLAHERLHQSHEGDSHAHYPQPSVMADGSGSLWPRGQWQRADHPGPPPHPESLQNVPQWVFQSSFAAATVPSWVHPLPLSLQATLHRTAASHVRYRDQLSSAAQRYVGQLVPHSVLRRVLRPGLLIHRSLSARPTYRLPAQTNRVVILVDPLDALCPFILGVEIFQPGHVTPRHVHEHAYELFFILGGEGVAWCEGQSATVRPGNVVVFPPGAVHAVDVGPDAGLYCLEAMLPNEMFAEFVKRGELGALRPDEMCVLGNQGCGPLVQ